MRFVSIDVETANPNMSSICQIGLVRFEGGKEVDAAAIYVDPRTYFDPYHVGIHGIDEETVRGAGPFGDAHSWLQEWTQGETVVCHTHFDRVAVGQACERHGLAALTCRWLDSARVTRRSWSAFADRGYGLKNVAQHFGISFQHHDALHDARTAGLILLRAIEHTGHDLEAWHQLARKPISRATIARTGDGDGGLAGETVVFTGALQIQRRAAAELAAKAGGDVQEGVTKHTTMLVVGDQDIARLNGQEKSGKHRKAETLIRGGQPIRIVGETDFMALAAITE